MKYIALILAVLILAAVWEERGLCVSVNDEMTCIKIMRSEYYD